MADPPSSASPAPVPDPPATPPSSGSLPASAFTAPAVPPIPRPPVPEPQPVPEPLTATPASVPTPPISLPPFPPEIRRARLTLMLTLALAVTIVDLTSKHLAFHYLKEDGESTLAWPGVLRFTRHLNTGVVWGMGQGYNRVFTGIAALAIPVILMIFSRMGRPRLPETLGLGLILGGTLGNLYDRFMHDAVRDFIHVIVINWPVFNVADSCICTGAGLVGLSLLFGPQARESGSAATASK